LVTWICKIKNISSVNVTCEKKEDLVLENTVTGVHEEKNENRGNSVVKRWMKKIMKVCRQSQNVNQLQKE